jgi:hypothetical protein
MYRYAVSAGADNRTGRFEHRRYPDITLVPQQRYLIEIYTQFRHTVQIIAPAGKPSSK